jgi:methylmalonyl-CoA mutase cobalamin-binding subunit
VSTMSKARKTILLVPLDPVHDFGLRLIGQALDKAGHNTVLLPPDRSIEEAAKTIAAMEKCDLVMVSRTISYGAPEILARFIDLLEAMGLRKRTKVIVGGMGIDIKLAAELGYDAGFPTTTSPEDVVMYVGNRNKKAPPATPSPGGPSKKKTDMTQDFSYRFRVPRIDRFLDDIADQIFFWAKNKTSPGIERAKIRREMIRREQGAEDADLSRAKKLRRMYLDFCDTQIAESYRGRGFPTRTWRIPEERLKSFEDKTKLPLGILPLRQPLGSGGGPLLFVQIGSGSPLMDVAHLKISESWGIDGFITICPSSGARNEGLLEGLLNHEGDGTLLTFQNLALIKKFSEDSTLWGIRAHRGLNSPESLLYAGLLKADLSKLNFVYGSLGAGTDPARLVVDTLESIRLAAEFGIPFDIPSNDELGGIPTFRSFAGLLVMAKVSLRLGARPILKPLFCYSPWIILSGKMQDNYVDYNSAKIRSLRAIVDAPLWVGEPAGFMTHTEDRIQSALTTALHVELCRSLGVQAVTVASTDEAYSRGVINVNPRLDAMKAVDTVFRFMGHARLLASPRADSWAEELVQVIEKVLRQARERNDFVQCLHEGVFGGEEDGVHPGRAGENTVKEIPAGT